MIRTQAGVASTILRCAANRQPVYSSCKVWNVQRNSPVSGSARWMAGHSKWANIRHKKGAKDKIRAAILGKASLGIMAASTACGGDMSNLRLQSAIAHAKSVQLPKDRIEEAIAKGTSKGPGAANLMNLRYDAMLNVGGTKIACIILALSDNRNRTASNVRLLVTKDGGGELMATNSLSYLFDHVGHVVVENVQDEEVLLECALEAGALNVEEVASDEDNDNNTASLPSRFVVTTKDTELFQVVTLLRDEGYNVGQFEHRYVLQDEALGGVQLSPDGEDALINFLDKADENEDVRHIFHNAI